MRAWQRFLGLSCLAVGLLGGMATPVRAQQDVFDLFFEIDSCVTTHCIDTAYPFQEVTAYLIVRDASCGGVSGWEAMVEIDGVVTAPSWTLTAGMDFDFNDTPTVQRFSVGIGVTPNALLPDACGIVHLATFSGFIQQLTDQVSFYIKGVPGSVTFPDPPSPGYVCPDNPGDTQYSTNIWNDFDIPVAQINVPGCVEPWSGLDLIQLDVAQSGDLVWTEYGQFAGMVSGANDGQDGFDLQDTGGRVWFENPLVPFDLDTDARAVFDPLTEMKQWTFVIEPDRPQSGGNRVNLDFFDLDVYGADVAVRLLDRAVSQWTDLQQQPIYNFWVPGGGGIYQRTFDLFIGESLVGPEFSVAIDACAEDVCDRGNIAATLNGADNGYDELLDTPEPPPPPSDFVALYFPHPEWGGPLGDQYMSDVRAPYDPLTSMKTWQFTVDSDMSSSGMSPITLDFDPSFAPDYNFRLRNHQSGDVVDLFAAGLSYTFTPPPSGTNDFDLMIGSGDVPELSPTSRLLSPVWTLLGMPLLPSGIGTYGTVLLDDAYGDANYIFEYQNSTGYVERQAFDPMLPGVGAWLGTSVGFVWSMSGDPDLGVIDIPLEIGWNLVGYPLWFPSDVNGVEVMMGTLPLSWGEAVGIGLVGSHLTGFDTGTGSYVQTLQLETWHGYWMECYADNLSLRFHWENMPQTALRRWQPFAELDDELNWRLVVHLEETESSVAMGTCELSNHGFDPYQDRVLPPTGPLDTGAGSIYLPRPDWNLATGSRLSQDIRGPETLAIAWDAVIELGAPGQAVLSWDPRAWGGTRDLQIYVPSQDRIVVNSMRTVSQVVLPVGSEPLTIRFRTPEAGTGVEESVTVFSKFEARPNPFNPLTELSFTAGHAGRCEVCVYDVFGRLVRRLDAGVLPAGGSGAVTWRGRDESGREVASGVYFGVLNVNGRPSGEIRKLSLVR